MLLGEWEWKPGSDADAIDEPLPEHMQAFDGHEAAVIVSDCRETWTDVIKAISSTGTAERSFKSPRWGAGDHAVRTESAVRISDLRGVAKSRCAAFNI